MSTTPVTFSGSFKIVRAGTFANVQRGSFVIAFPAPSMFMKWQGGRIPVTPHVKVAGVMWPPV